MSIKKIAQRAGCSPATVSRVLNHPGYKCAEPGLRDKIWEYAMEMEYAPNEDARSLKLGKGRNGARQYNLCILMTRIGNSVEDPFFRDLLHIVESEIYHNMCMLSKVWYIPAFSDSEQCRGLNIQRLVDEMYHSALNGCHGIVILGKCDKEVLSRIKTRYENVVSINRNSTNYEVDEVICDGRKIASAAMDYLLRLGHQSIGYAGECHNETRYAGYLETLKEHGIEPDKKYVMEIRQTEAAGYEAMERLLRLGEMPSGIYCANDITAIGMLKCLNKNKKYKNIPSIISSDDIEEAQEIHPMLTTVRLPREEMGKFAVELLTDRIRGGHKSVVKMEFEGKLMIRESCKRFQQ